MAARARALALGRVVFGALMLVNPEVMTRTWLGRRTAALSGTKTITRAFGARDLALGAGALAAFARGGDARGWVAAGGFCDVADLGATLTADGLPVAGQAMITALAGAAIVVSAGYLVSGDGARARPSPSSAQ